jgi:hypothetical protein
MSPAQPHPCCGNCKHGNRIEDLRVRCSVKLECEYIKGGAAKPLEALPTFTCERHERKK